MGNGLGKIGVCFTGDVESHRRHGLDVYMTDPCDESLGHSFCYVRPDPTRTTTATSKVHTDDYSSSALFRSISGASVSANTSTPLSTSYLDSSSAGPVSSAFESSTSFASIPLQPLPRSSLLSGPLSGPMERGFMSGPIERGFMSGPIDPAASAASLYSGPLEKGYGYGYSGGSSFRRSLSHSGWAPFGPRSRPRSLIRGLRRAISKKLPRGQSSIVAPVKGGAGSIKCHHQDGTWIVGGGSCDKNNQEILPPVNLSSEGSLDDGDSLELGHNLQWAQGRAGEDRVHVVVSEEHGWVFVGIYDGFSGPDATDFLLSNLYSFVIKELKGLLWEDKSESQSLTSSSSVSNTSSVSFDSTTSTSTSSCSSSSSGSEVDGTNHACDTNRSAPRGRCSHSLQQDCYPSVSGQSSLDSQSKKKTSSNSRTTNSKYRGAARKWKWEWDRERIELDRRLKEQLTRNGYDGSSKAINHSDVLKALSRALKKTEEAYFDIADKMLVENPELALMGSCVLAMLMKGEDVYLMNVGDSRAVLAQKAEPDLRLGKVDQDLERINEETLYDLEVSDGVRSTLSTFQLTVDHSTAEEEEEQRIRIEHPDDPCAILNDRVKGSLKVTRAFGAGFLKQPKWNEALLEMFRIDYVGMSPYLNCLPTLHHHRLGPKDRFLILSSDGLYQYFTNEEAVSEVELFFSLSPEGDPAQHLVEEVLFRAAKKAGLDFYDLLEIPQGERRRYHDDVSIIVISFEGRIWKSFV